MKKSPLIESIYNKLVNERVTDIVYHGTGLIELRQILEQDRVMTSVAQGVRSDSKLNKGKFFFFSTARSINTFREAFGLPQKAAVMVLDGRKLSQRYKAAAVDYWGPGFMDQDETEDRIVTDDPYIDDFSQYIKEVRILFPVKSFRSVSHAENDSIEKSVDILKAKGIPVKILTDKKYFYINNPKNYMTTKEEWAEFLEKSGYSIGEKRPEDDVGTNLRKATPFNDAANLAELIKMVEKGNLDFSSFPSNDKVTQIKNDLYKHLVDPDGDGKEPKYADDEDEKIKNMMLKGQQVISAQQVQDMYGQIVYYPRDFTSSIGTSIQNNRKNPDSRENLTVISKYMRKNKLRDLETLGAFLKTRIDAIRDGKMKKVAENIMDNLIEKKYDVKNPVLWSASYSDMIHFANTGDFFIPLGEDFLKRALDAKPTKGTVFHVTDYRGVYGLLNMQGKKKAIAGFTQLGDTVADKMFTRGVGAGRSSGFVVELEGDVLTSFFRDARTRPEKGGRRNVKLVTLQKSIGRQGFMKVRKEILQKLHQYNEKMGAKSKIPPQEKIPQGQDASVVLDAWRKQVMKAIKPGPRMTKRYKEQGKPVPKGDGKKMAQMVKYYLDTVEEIVKNNQEMFKKAIIDADMGEKGGYTGYDEKNIEKFRVKNVFLVKGSPAAEEVGDTNLPADLEKEGVAFMPGMSQEQMLQYINSAPKNEGWSEKYKKSIDCDNPKGFSQRAHCDGRKKKVEDIQQRIYNKIAEKSAKKYFEEDRKFLKEGKSSHYHSYPPSEEIKQIIDDNDGQVAAVCRIPGNCQDESYAWAKIFRNAGVDVELHHGMYKGEGHTWLVVDGGIFDPTAGQFDDFPEMEEFEYSTHEVEEELTEAGGDLSYLLLPVGQTQQIGAEKQDKKTKDGIERYSNKFGSYRYVMKMGDEIVGAIQVMSRDKSKGVAANVFVKPEYRRQGIAKRLLVQAKKDFDEVEYNPDQSDDGKAWVSSVSQESERKNNTSSISEIVYNKLLKGL